MSEINFKREIKGSAQELWNKIENEKDKMALKLRKFAPEIVSLTEEKAFEIKAKIFNARVEVKENMLDFKIKLPLLYRAFRSTIEKAVDDVLKGFK